MSHIYIIKNLWQTFECDCRFILHIHCTHGENTFRDAQIPEHVFEDMFLKSAPRVHSAIINGQLIMYD